VSAAGTTRIYDDRSFARRNWASLGILVVAVAWGVAESIRFQIGASDQTGLLFGLGFLVAAAYGFYRLYADSRDAIMRIDADLDNGQSVVTLWRPWGPQRLTAPLAALTGWRMYIAMKTRNQRNFLLRVHHPDYPRPLHVELLPGKTDLEALRRLAPEAIADFEMNVGARKSD
jgi:hypothetical protein